MSLPPGWAEATLGDVSDLNMGQSPAGEFTNSDNVGMPLVGGASDLKGGRVTPTRCTTTPTKVAQPNDIILCVRATIGRWATTRQEVCLGRGVAGLTPLIEAKWLQFFLTWEAEEIDKAGVGSTFRQVDKATLTSWPVFLPPLAEQRRIVAKLDALTVRLARARSEARRVRELAEKLRRGTLRQAFVGALTHSQSHADERGSTALPDGWTLQELGQISDIQGGIQVGKKRQGAVPLIETSYLRVANVQRGWLKLDEIKTIGVTAEERARLLLQPGDILMNEGGDRDKLGRGWVWQGQVADCIHQNHVFRIRLHDREFPPEFISHYANEFGQQYFIDEGTQTTNLASISKRKVAALPVPLPPVEEARRITKLITHAFARADRLEAEARKALALIDRLEAAILAKAFRGELVPQDPNDEPASVLLERIRARRAAVPKPRRGRRPQPAEAANA